MSRYQESVTQLLSLKRYGVRVGLEIMERLAGHFSNPHLKYKTLHIAGTNGKGSVSHKCAKALSLSGFRTGLYTSPHIKDFRERIKVDGVPIEEEKVVEYSQQLLSFLQQEDQAVFFDAITVIAMAYFAEMQVDYAVFEVGLGGRLDSTNIIKPECAVITSIGFDHCDVLGNTIEEITMEKAGVIKQGVPVVIGPNVRRELVEPVAEEKGSRLVQVMEGGEDFNQENSNIARAVLQVLKENGLNLTDQVIDQAIQEKPPLRQQHVIWQNRNFIIDVGHNISAMEALLRFLNQRFQGRSLQFVIGMSTDKDVQGVFQTIKSAGVQKVHLVTSGYSRLASADFLEEVIRNCGGIEVGLKGRVLDVVRLLLQQDTEDIIVFTGSFFIMADICSGFEEVGVNLLDVQQQLKYIFINTGLKCLYCLIQLITAYITSLFII